MNGENENAGRKMKMEKMLEKISEKMLEKMSEKMSEKMLEKTTMNMEKLKMEKKCKVKALHAYTKNLLSRFGASVSTSVQNSLVQQ